MFKIKNWGTHQPKMRTDRNVIWIKVYKRLLEDYDYQILTDSNRATLIELWLLGAENNGILPDVKEIAFRLRREKSFINKQLEELSSFVCQDVSESLPRNKKNVSLDVDVDVEVKKPNIIINAKADVVKKKSEYFDINRLTELTFKDLEIILDTKSNIDPKESLKSLNAKKVPLLPDGLKILHFTR